MSPVIRKDEWPNWHAAESYFANKGPRTMVQMAPYPEELADLIEHWHGRPGWTFNLIDDHVREHVDPADDGSPPLSVGLTLDIITQGFNSYHRPDDPWAPTYCVDCQAALVPEGYEVGIADDAKWPCIYYRRNAPRGYRVHHFFPVPPATYNRRSWRRWITDCVIKIETHEVMEFTTEEYHEDEVVPVGDGPGRPESHHIERPYAPNHGPGNDPYIIAELATAEDRATSFRGVTKQSL